MISKIVEIRDRGTFIPALAIQLGSEHDRERYLAWRAGFGETTTKQKNYVLLVHLERSLCQWNAFEWRDRTMHTAHLWLIEHFNEVQPGQVVDVEFILGETAEQKIGEDTA